MKTIGSVQELKELLADQRKIGKRVSFVPTMGAIHLGHLSLIELAKKQSDFVVASIFVNPLQFTSESDFALYPKNEEADSALLESAGVDILFLPSVDEVYPDGKMTNTHFAGPIGELYEGRSRKGHFDGMLTVVARFFEIVSPDLAVFGAKDAQQLFLVKQMTKQDNSILIVEGPTIRDPNGLALSSRNQRLSAEQIEVALTLSKALARAEQAASSGAAPSVSIANATSVFSANPEAKLDYLELVNPESFEPLEDGFKGQALIIVAAEVGNVRLIDNRSITF